MKSTLVLMIEVYLIEVNMNEVNTGSNDRSIPDRGGHEWRQH
jgi:hypothetical protein